MLQLLAAFALQQAVPAAPKPAVDSARSVVADSTRGRHQAPRRIPLTPELERSAFADTLARVILRRARLARLRQDSLLQSYDAKTYQRISMGMAFKALMRDRLAFREETSGRVRWVRDRGMFVDFTGSRAVIPIAGQSGHYASNVDMTPIPYFPEREPLFPMSAFARMRVEVDEEGFVHPLALGAEAYYRYRTGGSVAIVLPDKTRIDLRELEITARRADWKLFVGSFWFDERGGQLVRAAYRLSEPLDIWRIVEEEEDDDDDVPPAVKAMFTPAKADITGVTTEYELHEGKFWLPRANYAEGMFQIGFVRSPIRMEERFSYLSVNGLDSLPTLRTLAVSDTSRSMVKDSLEAADLEGDIVINVGGGPPDTSAIRRRADSDTTERGRRRRARIAERERQCATAGTYTRMVSRYDGALRYPVSVPCDSTKLLQSADLPKSIYDEGEEMFDERSRDELLSQLDIDLQPGMRGGSPVKPYWGLNLVRYNRVEGLSSAAGARWAPGGGWMLDGQARLGIADLEPNGELRLARSNARTTYGVGAFRRLAAANDRGDPLSFGASISHFLYGRDEGFYYRTAGLELTGQHGRFGQLSWRLFAEDQSTAEKETDYSLAKTFAGSDLLPNIVATEGVATGGAVTLGFSHGLDPRGWRLSGDWRGEGAFGDFDYARTALDATLSHGLPRGYGIGLTGAGGWSGGTLPPQRAWYLGGAQTVRGQVAGTMAGDAFWLGRLEIAAGRGAVRPVVFGDVGWAGARDRMFDQPGRVMSGAGVGASVLDGLMRVDLSRGIRPKEMWRLDLYLEARF
jgi:hypothetical protein